MNIHIDFVAGKVDSINGIQKWSWNQISYPAAAWDPALSVWISRWFNLKNVFSLAGVTAMVASLRVEGDPTLPLVETDWPEAVVPQDRVAPPPPLETADDGCLSPITSSWLFEPAVTINTHQNSSTTCKLDRCPGENLVGKTWYLTEIFRDLVRRQKFSLRTSAERFRLSL